MKRITYFGHTSSYLTKPKGWFKTGYQVQEESFILSKNRAIQGLQASGVVNIKVTFLFRGQTQGRCPLLSINYQHRSSVFDELRL